LADDCFLFCSSKPFPLPFCTHMNKFTSFTGRR
jgi:hypothetical protein